MTTVYKPLGRNFLTKTSERVVFSRPEVRKVKRVLFGPVDHTETHKFLEEELEKIAVTQSETWNFDFKREQMLNPDGIYNWRPATPHKTIRPIKKFPVIEVDNHEFYGQPNEIIRPIPIKVIQETETKSIPKSQILKSKPQRLITGKYNEIYYFSSFSKEMCQMTVLVCVHVLIFGQILFLCYYSEMFAIRCL